MHDVPLMNTFPFFYTLGDYSTYIPTHQRYDSTLASVRSVEMQQNVSTILNYEERSDIEMLLSKKTTYQTEKVTTMKYPGLELVPADERRKMVSVQKGGKVVTPYSHLGTLNFSKASTVTSTTKCPSKTEHTVVTCMENVIKSGNEFPVP
jgi:hypothetical protein